MSRLEAKVKADIMEYLKTREDVFVQRREALGTSYKKGVPDLYVVYKGYHIEIETKKEKGGHLSTEQEKFASKCPRYGMIYILARSVSDVDHIFKTIDSLK